MSMADHSIPLANLLLNSQLLLLNILHIIVTQYYTCYCYAVIESQCLVLSCFTGKVIHSSSNVMGTADFSCCLVLFY